MDLVRSFTSSGVSHELAASVLVLGYEKLVESASEWLPVLRQIGLQSAQDARSWVPELTTSARDPHLYA